MTQPDTLYTRLRAEIDRRLAVARAANGIGWWGVMGTGEFEDLGNRVVAFMRLFDPPAVIAWLEAELEVLERHVRTTTGCCLNCCDSSMHRDSGLSTAPYPCGDLKSLARRLGVSVDG